MGLLVFDGDCLGGRSLHAPGREGMEFSSGDLHPLRRSGSWESTGCLPDGRSSLRSAREHLLTYPTHVNIFQSTRASSSVLMLGASSPTGLGPESTPFERRPGHWQLPRLERQRLGVTDRGVTDRNEPEK